MGSGAQALGTHIASALDSGVLLLLQVPSPPFLYINRTRKSKGRCGRLCAVLSCSRAFMDAETGVAGPVPAAILKRYVQHIYSGAITRRPDIRAGEHGIEHHRKLSENDKRDM